MTGERGEPAHEGRVAIVVHADRIRVLVVGAGSVGELRALRFADAGARVRVIAPRAEDALRHAAAAGRVDLALREYQSSDIADAELVIAATDDRETNARVAADARVAHRLCNVADLPDDGSFSAVAQRATGSLLIAVGTNGVPAAATRILAAICDRFDGRYADAIGALRLLRQRLLARGGREEWERASRELVGDSFTAQVEAGSTSRSAAGWP